MDNIITNQAILFTIYGACGIVIGLLFDIFRILRRSFKTTDTITYIEDIIFGILTGIFLIFMLFIFSNGQLRLYIFLAITLGLILYFITISKYFIKINVKILKILKKIIISIISVFTYPFKKISKLLSRVILKPFRILIINIKNTNFKKIKIHKLKKDKKMQNKKRILRNNVE